jgi:cell division protein ZapE
VGRGKTMLMDMFFEAVETPRKRRAHFHAFMADVHARLNEWRQARKRGDAAGEDPIAPVAADLAREASLLCFDEFSVRDIADAMILSRLFTTLFAAGVVVVATSNVAPDDLYKDGLNRALFLPFITLIKERLDVIRLDARTDYRLEKLKRAPVYYTPLGPKTNAALDAAFLTLTGHERGEPIQIELLGRHLDVPQAIDGVARFDFDALCRRPLGAADYLKLAQRPHTLVLDRIPYRRQQGSEAKRFIGPIDISMICASSDASAGQTGDALFRRGVEAFEFARALRRDSSRCARPNTSRSAWARRGAQAGDLGGIAET